MFINSHFCDAANARVTYVIGKLQKLSKAWRRTFGLQRCQVNWLLNLRAEGVMSQLLRLAIKRGNKIICFLVGRVEWNKFILALYKIRVDFVFLTLIIFAYIRGFRYIYQKTYIGVGSGCWVAIEWCNVFLINSDKDYVNSLSQSPGTRLSVGTYLASFPWNYEKIFLIYTGLNMQAFWI